MHMTRSAGVFDDPEALDADLAALEHLRRSRRDFADRICAASISQAPQVLEHLRTEAMYDFSEFYYLIKARQIVTPEQLEMLAELHNNHIVALMRDESKMARLGLKPDRLLQSIFTADTLPRLVENWKARPGSIDQSNLARLLCTVMSTETTRKLVIASTEAGFLNRERTPYGTIVVESCSVMEQVFGSILRDFRLTITGMSRLER